MHSDAKLKNLKRYNLTKSNSEDSSRSLSSAVRCPKGRMQRKVQNDKPAFIMLQNTIIHKFAGKYNFMDEGDGKSRINANRIELAI